MKKSYYIITIILGLSCNTTKNTVQNTDNNSDATSILKEDVDRSMRPKAGKAKEITIGNYQEFTLENGLKVFVIENHKLPTVSFSLSLNNPPVLEGNKAGCGNITGELLEAGTTTKSKEALNEEIDFMGAFLSASQNSIYVSGLSRHKENLVSILSDVTLNPKFAQDEFDKIIKLNLTNLEVSSANPDYISSIISSQVLYGKNHPYGEFETAESIKNLTLEDCKAYYNETFKPNVALLTIVGDITLSEAKNLITKNLGNWVKGSQNSTLPSLPTNPSTPVITVVNKEGAVQSNIFVGNVTDLKPGDSDYEAVKVLNQIFGSGFSGRLFKSLREDKEYTYGAYGDVSSDKYIGNFSAEAKVRNSVTDSAIDAFLEEINKIRTENVTEEELVAAKNMIAGSFAQSLESPQTIASFAGSIEINNLPKDYYKNYLKRIEAVTIQDVKNAAIKHMKPENINIVVVGNALEVGPKLTRFGELTYMDKEGNKVDAPKSIKKVGKEITPELVMDNYIKAIGGKEKINSIKTIVTKMEASLQGIPLVITQTQSAPNKSNFTIEGMGMVIMEQTFNGEKAKVTSQGRERKVEDDQLADMKVEQQIIPELAYKNNVEVEGIVDVNGTEAYQVKVTLPSGATQLNFYEIKSGLKVRETKNVDGPTGPVSQTTDFSDYKTTEGIMLPYTIKMPLGGGMDLTAGVKSIEINKEIDPTLFKL